MVCQFIFKMIKICKFDHLISCSDYFARFFLFKRAFSMKKVMLKNSRRLRYITLNPFDVNDDVIFLFTFYK